MNGLVRLQGEQSQKYLCFSKKGKLRAQVSYFHETYLCSFYMILVGLVYGV
jgi:hypothetical protein